jgi:hypothetical protein
VIRKVIVVLTRRLAVIMPACVWVDRNCHSKGGKPVGGRTLTLGTVRVSLSAK